MVRGGGGGGGGANSKRTADTPDAAMDAKKARQAGVTNAVKDLDAQGARYKLAELMEAWQLDDVSPSFISMVERSFVNFDMGYDGNLAEELHDTGSYGLRKLDDVTGDHEVEAIALYHRLHELGLFSEADDGPELLSKSVKVIEMIYYAKRIVMSSVQAKLAVYELHPVHPDQPVRLDEDLDTRLGSWALRFRWIDASSVTPMQKLLLYLLDAAMEKRYRKQGDWCYEPVVVGGRTTHAWRPVCEIKTFVHEMVQKERAWEQWCYATASMKNIPSAIEYLTACKDYQFPQLVKTRGVYSFRNAVYVCREDAIKDACQVPDTVVAAKFFDTDLDRDALDRPDWRDIATPHFQGIMDYQDFEPAVRDWMYIMLGRCLYELNDLDGWQVIPFMKGLAGSGKSTILLKIAKNFYEAIDVGVLSNNIEVKFGISAFVDKYLFVAPEIKNDLRIEQAEFQSMVSGEDLQINVKFQKAFATQWKVPGMLAGNEVPGWADNAGSIQRRIVLFDFINTVVHGDMKLDQKLYAEAPLILVKCNRAYLEASSRYGQKNIWTVLPDYFKGTREQLAQSASSLEAFLASSDVVLAPEVYCPFKEFKDRLKGFENDNGFKPKQYQWDFFSGPLQKKGVKKVMEKRTYRGRSLTQEYLVGVDLAYNQIETGLG